MVERPEATPEGWSVRHRPAVIAGLATPLVLLMLLLVAGWFYDRDFRSSTRQPVQRFPAPGLETFIHDGPQDPHRPRARMEPDGKFVAAKRAIVVDGIPGWERQR